MFGYKNYRKTRDSTQVVSDSEKDLWIIVDNQLSMNSQWDFLAKGAYALLGYVNSNVSNRTRAVLLLLFLAVV